MILEEMLRLFIDSRKRGVCGARQRCRPKSISVYENNLKVFFGFLQTGLGKDVVITRYENIRRMHILQFLDWMEEQVKTGRWSRATVLQLLRTLKAFFRWVDLDEDCQLSELKGLQKYLPTIEKTPRRKDMPLMVDLRKFKNSFNTDGMMGFRDYVATNLMLDTGIRVGEVCNLKLNQVRLEEKVLIVDGKTGPRPVSITNEMVRLLKSWLRKRQMFPHAKESDFLFVSKYDQMMTPGGFSQSFRKHFRKLGIARVTPHTLRHVFATNYLRKGGSIEKLRMMTGHKSYDMLKDYLHLAEMGGDSMQKDLEKVSILKDL
jgi:site-specific recombinase XerD